MAPPTLPPQTMPMVEFWPSCFPSTMHFIHPQRQWTIHPHWWALLLPEAEIIIHHRLHRCWLPHWTPRQMEIIIMVAFHWMGLNDCWPQPHFFLLIHINYNQQICCIPNKRQRWWPRWRNKHCRWPQWMHKILGRAWKKVSLRGNNFWLVLD